MLDKFWVTQCGWLRLCVTVSMGMNINYSWKLFSYGVERDHYYKLIVNREFLERLALYCFNNNLSTDTVAPENNITTLDEIDEGDIVSTCHVHHFSSYISISTEVSTVYYITLNSASLLVYNLVASTIGSQNTSEEEEAR